MTGMRALPLVVLGRALNWTMHTPASARDQHNRGTGVAYWRAWMIGSRAVT